MPRSISSLLALMRNGELDIRPGTNSQSKHRNLFERKRMTHVANALMDNRLVQPLILNNVSISSRTLLCVDGNMRLEAIRAFVDGIIPCEDALGREWYFKEWMGPKPEGYSRRPKLLSETQRQAFLSKVLACCEYPNLSENEVKGLFTELNPGRSWREANDVEGNSAEEIGPNAEKRTGKSLTEKILPEPLQKTPGTSADNNLPTLAEKAPAVLGEEEIPVSTAQPVPNSAAKRIRTSAIEQTLGPATRQTPVRKTKESRTSSANQTPARSAKLLRPRSMERTRASEQDDIRPRSSKGGNWSKLAKEFKEDFQDVLDLLTREEMKEHYLTMCFAQLLETQVGSTGQPTVLRCNKDVLAKFVNDGSTLTATRRSHFAKVFNTFHELVAEDPRTFTENDYERSRVFSPVEFVAVAVLISRCGDYMSHEKLLESIRAMRQAARDERHVLYVDSGTWGAFWKFIMAIHVPSDSQETVETGDLNDTTVIGVWDEEHGDAGQKNGLLMGSTPIPKEPVVNERKSLLVKLLYKRKSVPEDSGEGPVPKRRLVQEPATTAASVNTVHNAQPEYVDGNQSDAHSTSSGYSTHSDTRGRPAVQRWRPRVPSSSRRSTLSNSTSPEPHPIPPGDGTVSDPQPPEPIHEASPDPLQETQEEEEGSLQAQTEYPIGPHEAFDHSPRPSEAGASTTRPQQDPKISVDHAVTATQIDTRKQSSIPAQKGVVIPTDIERTVASATSPPPPGGVDNESEARIQSWKCLFHEISHPAGSRSQPSPKSRPVIASPNSPNQGSRSNDSPRPIERPASATSGSNVPRSNLVSAVPKPQGQGISRPGTAPAQAIPASQRPTPSPNAFFHAPQPIRRTEPLTSPAPTVNPVPPPSTIASYEPQANGMRAETATSSPTPDQIRKRTLPWTNEPTHPQSTNPQSSTPLQSVELPAERQSSDLEVPSAATGRESAAPSSALDLENDLKPAIFEKSRIKFGTAPTGARALAEKRMRAREERRKEAEQGLRKEMEQRGLL